MKPIFKPFTVTGRLALLFLFPGSVSLLAVTSQLPRFIDYPASPVYRGKTHALLSRYKGAIPKSGIPDAQKRKADFSGHYVVVQGSCGTGCRSLGAMDATTGIVYWFRHTLTRDYGSDLPATRYRLTSKLLILHCNLDENRATNGTYYYVFKDNRFVRVRYIPIKYLDPYNTTLNEEAGDSLI